MQIIQVPGTSPEVLLSASDLRRAAGCEHALLADLDVALDRRPAPEPVEDEVLARVAELGHAHEQRVLRALAAERPGAVRSAPRPEPTPEGYAAAHAQTLAWLADPAVDLVVQAVIAEPGFVGVADFLLRGEDGRWVVCDAKLARRESVEALLQVGAYADILQRGGVPVSPVLRLVLGDEDARETRLDDVLPVVRARRARLSELVTTHLQGPGAADLHDASVAACLVCDTCQAQLHGEDDVLLVAGVHAAQRTALAEVGVVTVGDLAALPQDTVVPGLRAQVRDRLRAQARLQLAAREAGTLTHEVVTPAALALPTPSPGDVFFDFEADPMWHEPGSRTWGLEYLFGCLTLEPDGSTAFTAFWAHDRRQEGAALRAFLDWLQQRRRRWPDLHVYHYSGYERSALLRLAARHGEGQEEVDGLLRDRVLVDLYATVKQSVRVGTGSYSIKQLEPLYMGDELRAADGVTGGGDSIVEYHRYVQALVDGDAVLAAERLEDIRQYNEYDCLSTLRLRDWLRARADEHQVADRPGGQGEDPDAAVEPPAERTEELLALVGDDPAHERSPQQQAVAMLAAAVGYHRREDKPYWWGHFDRLGSPVEEWAAGTDVLRGDRVEQLTEWVAPTPRSSPRRTLRVVGEDRGLSGRGLVAVYHDPPADVAQEGQVGAHRAVRLLAREEVIDPSGAELVAVTVEESAPRGTSGYPDLPVGLGPDAPPRADNIVTAISDVAQQVLDAQTGERTTPAPPNHRVPPHEPVLPPGPALDLLARRAPRTTAHQSDDATAELPRTGDDVADVRDALLSLDRSYLAVQGPPGTGKTHVGAHVVSALVREHGWRVGVVAQSHAAVENMLDAIVTAGVPAEQVGKSPKGEGERTWTELTSTGYAPFAAEHAAAGRGYVLGGTAWDLTNRTRIEAGQLDLVVVDEAGQLAIAPTIGVSTAGARLLLLGDPQQLPQVSQGTHPEPVDRSALGWLLGDAETIPDELGYFLAQTWRMHPALTAPVSRLAYDDRLRSREEVTTGRDLAGIAPGLHVVEVEHAGRTTESPEEAERVAQLVADLVGRPWTDGAGTRPLTPADVLVVAPYNHQVAALQDALARDHLEQARVGTVDSFQGQQAPVVIVSMSASSAHDISRGLGFLLDRHRLNVAVSRGQHAAFVVMSPVLADAAPRSSRELVTLGAFLGLLEARVGALV
ncbi:TM0106 family RecB-like putative nuclease [Janibacter alkaliphilus]|uniref:Uncharacterized protein n=1 Tax=Janibacter alkaliphilus TaxID=1069963 RepID=A0A852X187_9MICO|nr:bifunctional RecB family nuclease/DEAD/DEAH box helicase [Janibacter alkaliphilus]NYG37082.1 uncharacterized protein [Janibacter alkaliphilus]